MILTYLIPIHIKWMIFFFFFGFNIFLFWKEDFPDINSKWIIQIEFRSIVNLLRLFCIFFYRILHSLSICAWTNTTHKHNRHNRSNKWGKKWEPWRHFGNAFFSKQQKKKINCMLTIVFNFHFTKEYKHSFIHPFILFLFFPPRFSINTKMANKILFSYHSFTIQNKHIFSHLYTHTPNTRGSHIRNYHETIRTQRIVWIEMKIKTKQKQKKRITKTKYEFNCSWPDGDDKFKFKNEERENFFFHFSTNSKSEHYYENKNFYIRTVCIILILKIIIIHHW